MTDQEKLIRRSEVPREDWDRAPWNRWSFQHLREILPSAEVWRGNGPASTLPRASQNLADIRFKSARGEISVISVDPVITSAHDYLGRDKVKHVAVNPQADVPLQLALAHTLYTEKLYDTHFVDNYCVGFEQFLPYLLGETDAQP